MAQGTLVVPDLEVIADMARRLRPLLDRVHLGRLIDWDGNNMVGVLDADACEASDAIADIMAEDWTDPALAGWDAADWLWPVRDNELTGDMTDNMVAALAAELIVQALRDGVLLDGDVEDILRDWRDELAHAQEEDVGDEEDDYEQDDDEEV